MLFPDRIDYRLGVDDIFIPRMFRARQKFSRDRIADIEATVAAQMATLDLPDLTGKRIALTAGSRGVANQARLLKAAITFFQQRGALPCIVPGMGSHGGATAEGQIETIAGYGISEESMGVPILSSMDVVQLGSTASGFPVYCDSNAMACDYIFPVHRVKPHTDFKGAIESGLCKMLVIGLGKHKGASQIHKLGVSHFSTLIPEAAEHFFATGKVLAGLAVVENAYDETMHIEAIPTATMVEREKELLVLAKKSIARFCVDAIDVLVVEEMGKDISGSGMDSNITGFPTSQEPGFDACPIRRIAVLGISELSHGNATGLGVAHIVTINFMKQLDMGATYTNSITSRVIEGARLPLVANSDYDAVRIGLFCGMGIDETNPKIIHIRNTLRLDDMFMSEAYLPAVKQDSARFDILSDPEPMRFDPAGRLVRMDERA